MASNFRSYLNATRFRYMGLIPISYYDSILVEILDKYKSPIWSNVYSRHNHQGNSINFVTVTSLMYDS